MKLVYCDFIAGYFGGACGIIFGHPFDTIKTWQQRMNTKIGTTMYNIIIRNNGLNGFYKGFYFPLITNGSINAIVFGTYANVFRMFQERCSNDMQRQKLQKNHLLFAGCCGGFIQAALGCPIEVVKIRLQTLGYIGRSYDCMKFIFKHEGLYGLYRGLVPTIWREILPYGIYLYVYDWMYNLGNCISLVKHSRMNRFNESGRLGQKLDVFMTTLAGLVAVVFSWALVAPLDCVKTIMQAEIDPNVHRTMYECVTTLLREHNYRAFFRGTSMIIGKSYAIFLGYQYCLNKCQVHVQNQKQQNNENKDTN